MSVMCECVFSVPSERESRFRAHHVVVPSCCQVLECEGLKFGTHPTWHDGVCVWGCVCVFVCHSVEEKQKLQNAVSVCCVSVC